MRTTLNIDDELMAKARPAHIRVEGKDSSRTGGADGPD